MGTVPNDHDDSGRDDWWGTRVFGRTPAPRYVTFQFHGPETSVAIALTANDLDSPNIGILSLGPFREVAARNPTVGAWLAAAPYACLDPCPRALMVNNANPPLDRKDVRWALSHFIDRAAVVTLAYEGTNQPSRPHMPGALPRHAADAQHDTALQEVVMMRRILGAWPPLGEAGPT